jgi:hypothetical protein
MNFSGTIIAATIVVILSSAFILHSPTTSQTGKRGLNNTADSPGITKGYFSKDGIPVPGLVGKKKAMIMWASGLHRAARATGANLLR